VEAVEAYFSEREFPDAFAFEISLFLISTSTTSTTSIRVKKGLIPATPWLWWGGDEVEAVEPSDQRLMGIPEPTLKSDSENGSKPKFVMGEFGCSQTR